MQKFSSMKLAEFYDPSSSINKTEEKRTFWVDLNVSYKR